VDIVQKILREGCRLVRRFGLSFPIIRVH
jgi:hypothetical protein